MKTKAILAAALAAGLALTTVRAADVTPAETKAIANLDSGGFDPRCPLQPCD